MNFLSKFEFSEFSGFSEENGEKPLVASCSAENFRSITCIWNFFKVYFDRLKTIKLKMLFELNNSVKTRLRCHFNPVAFKGLKFWISPYFTVLNGCAKFERDRWGGGDWVCTLRVECVYIDYDFDIFNHIKKKSTRISP